MLPKIPLLNPWLLLPFAALALTGCTRMAAPIISRARLLVVLAPLWLAPASAWAGDCLARDADYVKELEAVARGKIGMHQTSVHCLGLGRFRRGTNRWAGPIAARNFARLRRSRYRQRIARACQRIIRGHQLWSSRTCVRLLADYGIQKVGKLDTFALQRRLFPNGLRPIHLATLGDQRAVAELMARFGATRVCTQYRRDDGRRGRHCADYSERARRRNRWRRKAHRAHKINVLNALWHLADPASRAFLEKVAKNDPDKKVRHRAVRALMQVLQQEQKRSGG